MSKINTSNREIHAICMGMDLDMGHVVGQNGVTEIVPYEESGEMAMVPWFKVYVGDGVKFRVNAAFVGEVIYE